MIEVKQDACPVDVKARTEWKQPAVRRMDAGSAEASAQNAGDGLTGS
jgi:hypothetical protein